MRRLGQVFNQIMLLLRLRRRSRPEDIPKKLPPDMLEAAMKEARFLSGHHQVDVTSLRPGELPGIPRRAGQEPPPPEEP